ncbi:MAG TPA: thioredoxin [Bacteroidetes bacterium]|nr:thioredoxin [Bacteroidota bacterium]HRR08802.1 thioredoxin [Rhodothermales bacterium]
MTNTPTIFNITAAQFEQAVIRASFEKPVLVDFWAPWCGPCRMIGPILEKLAAEQSETWSLVKLNTDENPDISARYQIRGIPAVKLFIAGDVVAEFTGALPEHALRKWLSENIPSQEKKLFEEAKRHLAAGETGAGVALLEELFADNPQQLEYALSLAEVLLFSDPNRASALLAPHQNAKLSSEWPRISGLTNLLTWLITPPDVLPEGTGKPILETVLVAMRQQDFATVAAGLIELLQKDRMYFNEAAKTLGVAFFSYLGFVHPVAKQYRRSFDMWLYA